jgi:chitinase
MPRMVFIILTICTLFSLLAVASAKAAPVRANRGAWAPNTAYAVNDTVTYSGSTYFCIQAHTSLTGWEPPNVPALWGLVTGPTATTGAITATRTRTRTPTPGGPTATRTNTPSGPTRTPTRTATRTNSPTRTMTPTGPVFTPTRTPTQGAGTLPKHIMVGYWHNFDNGSGFIPLRNVSPKWDVINVSFAEPVNTGGTIGFTPYNTSVAQFQADIAYLHSQGKKVIISIGGANGTVQLNSTSARDNFVNSMNSIISTYGFDGMDIDFEGQSLILNAGDSDPTNPTTPGIVNTIAAIRSVRNRFGSNFILTMAPETFFVQLGYSFYGGTCSGCDRRAGAFLPVIYGTRDILTWLQVQDYNSGPITGLDNQYHSMGNADFHSAMLDMLLAGFSVAGTGKSFPALRADQVALGVPATVNAGNGYLPPGEVQKALNYIIKGQSYGGSYVKRSANAAALRGVMTWSVNWDAYAGIFEFSNSYRTYLNGLP